MTTTVPVCQDSKVTNKMKVMVLTVIMLCGTIQLCDRNMEIGREGGQVSDMSIVRYCLLVKWL